MISPLKTCTQINEDIVLHLGWTSGPGMTGAQLQNPDGEEIGMSPPDFCGEWEYVGPLQIPLHHKYIVDVTHDDIRGWRMRLRRALYDAWQYEGRGNTLTEAIARAYHVAFVEERTK